MGLQTLENRKYLFCHVGFIFLSFRIVMLDLRCSCHLFVMFLWFFVILLPFCCHLFEVMGSMVQTKFYWLIGQPNLDPFDPHNQRPSSSKLFFWLKAHWHECLIETMPTYILHMQTFSITKDLLRALFCKLPCWRSKRSHALSSSPKLASNWRDESDNCLTLDNTPNNNVGYKTREECVKSNNHLPWSFPSSCFARHPQCQCCWCLQLQRSSSMQGWWRKRQNGFAPWTCRHP